RPTPPTDIHTLSLHDALPIFKHSGVKDRGFMDSIYFTDPLGLLIELASYRFEPPAGFTHAEVLLEAHQLRVARDDYNIAPIHLRSEEHTSELQSRSDLVCRLL